jgi:prevent-host-death family protein
MHSQHPNTQTMKITDVKNQLSSLVNEVYRKETRILVEKAGIPVAGLVSAADLERLNRLDRERDELFAVIDRAREAFKDVPPEEIERETDRIIARNRAADRAASKELAATG